ncbi:AraC family transcriptional regulator [Bacillus sp. FJAT-49711]|uniref:AraC family transcriptional regulator n=1 Tax=Bacillus sp. FJAT-49711 TaxID=2833585 RepID=UPI001BC92AEC|nr:AraC family transcriptional regulator [Bacillus sp. FJAT-49711]MBS4220451.1 AraC family transcriptional regulator [Bacillus sp. FJAT-49711]
MVTNFYRATPLDISREKKIHTTMPDRHYHDGYEILYLVSGNVYYFIEDKTYQVSNGTLLIINKNDIHKLVNSSGTTFERVTLLFKYEFINKILNTGWGYDVLSIFSSGRNIIRLEVNEQNVIENLFDKMVFEFKIHPAGYEDSLRILLLEVLIFIKRIMDSKRSDDDVETNFTHKKVFDIVDFINQHYQQRLTVEEISRKFYISPSYFYKIFKENTGFTFIEYLNNVRVKEAISLLKENRYKVGEVGEKVGFESITHFGRVFKGITGYSPVKYRNIHFLKI